MDKAETMFSRFYLLPVTPEIAIKAAKIGTYLVSQGKEVDIMDTYIALARRACSSVRFGTSGRKNLFSVDHQYG